jgi:endonuclease/exonuclease/phosphatase family metal-dependent hydrolase
MKLRLIPNAARFDPHCLFLHILTNAAEADEAAQMPKKEIIPSTRPVPTPLAIRVMSFNIRNSGAADGANAWEMRRELVLQTIANAAPDLLGLQEVLADQRAALMAALTGCAFAGVARDDGDRAGEWALIGYRPERFEMLEQGNFWLAAEPRQPALGWDAACVRLCSWARLVDRSSGQTILFANTHWDHHGLIARAQSAKLTGRMLATLARGAAVILSGDFNSTEDDPWMQSLISSDRADGLPLIDAHREVHPRREPEELSFHGFDGRTRGSRIDFILHGPGLRAVDSRIIRAAGTDGRYPSDHYPLIASLEYLKLPDGDQSHRAEPITG